MKQKPFLLGLLCLGLILSSCKKEGADATGDNQEAVWNEIAKISAVAKFSRIDTLRVNQNIEKGVLTISNLRETVASSSLIPITDDSYTEDTYLGTTTCPNAQAFTVWGLKSRGYPYRYRISWGSSGWTNLDYPPSEPSNSIFTYTSNGASGNCVSATGWGTLEQDIMGFHWEWDVEGKVSQFAQNLWLLRLTMTKKP